MSSIYRKGRDGYFYYQTYVKNPKTGKKDKRIFHSLRTKNRQEAERKQSDLDARYNQVTKSSKYYFKDLISTNKVSVIGPIIATLVLTFFLIDAFKPSMTNKRIVNLGKIANKKEKAISELNESSATNNDFVEHDHRNSIIKSPKSSTSKMNDDYTVNSSSQISSGAPGYEIVRIQRISETFKQGRVFVVINENTSNENQLALCQNLTKQFSEFSNIVICLYANNSAGIKLAEGKRDATTGAEQRQYWLAMYTFNSVEGEYFDDYPSGYLGSY